MGLRDIYKQNIMDKRMYQQRMRGRNPIMAPQTPIANTQAPIASPPPMVSEGVPFSGEETPIGADSPTTGVGGAISGGEIESDVGATLDPGEGYGSDTSLMGTGEKMSRGAASAMMGPLNLVKGAYRSGENLMTGNLGLGDLSTSISLAGAGNQIAQASQAGATSGQIMQGMANINPMQVGASMLTTGILSELGFDQSGMGRFGRNIGGMIGSMAGPLGSVAGQLGGGTLGSALADVTGTRSNEATREGLEQLRGASGWGGWARPASYVGAQRDYARFMKNEEQRGMRGYMEDQKGLGETYGDIMGKFGGEGQGFGEDMAGDIADQMRAGGADPTGDIPEGVSLLPEGFDERGFDLDADTGGEEYGGDVTGGMAGGIWGY